jgi:hypothetical protein
MQHDAHAKAWRQYCKKRGILCWAGYVAGLKAGDQLANKALPQFSREWLRNFEGTKH